MPKKKFKETKVGQFLVGKGGVFDTIGDVLPDKGFLGVLKHVIGTDDALPPQDKETALKLLEMDLEELRSVSDRWASDMTSDSWFSKNTRPLVLIYLTFCTTLFVVLDSTGSEFAVGKEWIELLKTLLVTTYVAYFGSRGIEKYKALSQ